MVTPERLDLARGLHDGIAQDLVGLGYSLDLLLADDTLSLNTRLSLRSARLHIDELIHKVRAEIYHLRLEPQLSLSTELNQLAQSEYSDFGLDLELEDVKPSVEITSEVIAITREALRNIRTHARATRIGITLYPINNRICLQ
ncbi:MAG: histidine kinase, partial [Candidatus Planktophila sp.]